MTKRKTKNHGMHWIRPEKRLAIYLRDGLACVYCGEGIDDGACLTLDHLKPYSQGGSNHRLNLVTCCRVCNVLRGKQDWKRWAEEAERMVHNALARRVVVYVETTRRRKVNVVAAKELIKLRGSFTLALKKQTD